MNPLLSRRQLLLTSVAAPFVKAHNDGGKDGRGLKIVVIGAGLAGLNAALILERQGYEVEVVEARARVLSLIHI